MRLKGKVVLISGGARGMGAVEAELFASHGAKVVIGDILIEEGRLTAQRIVDQGGQAYFQPLDVTDEGQWASIVAETVDRFGGVDVLVNNAGIYRIATIEQTSRDVFRQIMEVNVAGVFLGTRTVSRKCGSGAGDPSSTSLQPPVLPEAQIAPHTRPPRGRYASSPSPPPSSTWAAGFALTRSTPA